MSVLFLIYFFVMGLIVGSFLNVVIYRYNTGRTVNGRSGCLTCGKTLTAWELIPVFSYIFLRGKCSGCESKISIQYPLVELSTGLIFVALVNHFSILFSINYLLFSIYYVLFAAIFSILIVIFVYDIKHKIIPDGLVFVFGLLAFVYQMTVLDFTLINISFWLDALAGFLFFIPFFLLWFLSNGRWIGLGDGKLVVGIGWALGFVSGVSAIILAFWIGAVFSVVLLYTLRLKGKGSHITMKTEVPFAPFLIIGFMVAFFYHIDFFNLTFLFEI